jgi:hypothetical protein
MKYKLYESGRDHCDAINPVVFGGTEQSHERTRSENPLSGSPDNIGVTIAKLCSVLLPSRCRNS